MSSIDKTELKSKALGMVARRSLTRKELKDRLKKFESNTEIVLEIVDEFESKGFIDEAGIIEEKILLGKESKLYGRRRIKLELMRRGLQPEIIDDSIEQLFPLDDEIDVAFKFAIRKLNSMGDVKGIKRYRRIASALQRRGFQGELISRTLERAGISRFDGDSVN